MSSTVVVYFLAVCLVACGFGMWQQQQTIRTLNAAERACVDQGERERRKLREALMFAEHNQCLLEAIINHKPMDCPAKP